MPTNRWSWRNRKNNWPTCTATCAISMRPNVSSANPVRHTSGRTSKNASRSPDTPVYWPVWPRSTNSAGGYDLAEPLQRRRWQCNSHSRAGRIPSPPKSRAILAPCSWLKGATTRRNRTFKPHCRRGRALLAIITWGRCTRSAPWRNCHIAQGREDEAIPLLRRVASVYEAKLGRQHPATAGAYVDVGSALQIAKKYDEAEAIFREQLATFTATLGTGHPRTGSCLYGLATIKLKRGEMQAALDLLDQISAIHQQYPPNERSVATVIAFGPSALEIGKATRGHPGTAVGDRGTRAQRGNVSGSELERADYLATLAPEFETMIQWQAELGDMPELFRAIEGMKARSFLDELNSRELTCCKENPPPRPATRHS